MTLRSHGKIPRKKPTTNEAASKMFTARCSVAPSHMRVNKSPRRKCRRINQSSGCGSFWRYGFLEDTEFYAGGPIPWKH